MSLELNWRIKQFIKYSLPYGLVEKILWMRENEYIQDYLEYKERGGGFFDENVKANYKMIVAIQGFGYSGSGAVVDLLREYDVNTVFGHVDREGSLSNLQITAGEMDFMRLSGGLFDIEKHINDNNIFINDALLHRYLKLVQATTICRRNARVRDLFYGLFDYLTENNLWGLSQRFYNRHILPSGKSEIFFLKQMNPKEFEAIIKFFLITLFNILNVSCKEIIVLDQFCSDMNFNYKHYSQYIDNFKFIAVYRDPRDIYTFALLNNIEWIPHNNADSFVRWCRIMYRRFGIQDTSYLTVRFEDLITNYDQTVKSIEDYIGIDSNKHNTPLKHFNPSVSAENMSIWKKYRHKYKEHYDYIFDELMPYCFMS